MVKYKIELVHLEVNHEYGPYLFRGFGGKIEMYKSFLLVMLVGITIFGGACSRAGTDSPDKKEGRHGTTEKADIGLVDFVRTHKLANFQSNTIGGAFESYRYLVNKDWKMKQEGRTFTVSFLGWFEPDALSGEDKKGGVTGKGLEVMFVVEPNGSFYLFMISVIEARSDGKMYRNQIPDSAGILASIYANRKISL